MRTQRVQCQQVSVAHAALCIVAACVAHFERRRVPERRGACGCLERFALARSPDGDDDDPVEGWRRDRWRAMLATYSAAIEAIREKGGLLPLEAAEMSPPALLSVRPHSAGVGLGSAGAAADAGVSGGDGVDGAQAPAVLPDPKELAAQLGIELGTLAGVGPGSSGADDREGDAGAVDGMALWDESSGWSEEAEERRQRARAYVAWKKAILWDFVLSVGPDRVAECTEMLLA